MIFWVPSEATTLNAFPPSSDTSGSEFLGRLLKPQMDIWYLVGVFTLLFWGVEKWKPFFFSKKKLVFPNIAYFHYCIWLRNVENICASIQSSMIPKVSNSTNICLLHALGISHPNRAGLRIVQVSWCFQPGCVSKIGPRGGATPVMWTLVYKHSNHRHIYHKP